jgi:hypothetical protein
MGRFYRFHGVRIFVRLSDFSNKKACKTVAWDPSFRETEIVIEEEKSGGGEGPTAI